MLLVHWFTLICKYPIKNCGENFFSLGIAKQLHIFMICIRFCKVNLHSSEFPLYKYSRRAASVRKFTFALVEGCLNFIVVFLWRRREWREKEGLGVEEGEGEREGKD